MKRKLCLNVKNLLFLLGCSFCLAISAFTVKADAAAASNTLMLLQTGGVLLPECSDGAQLVQVDYTSSDGAVSQSLFQYDDNGMLAAFSNQLRADTGDRSLKYYFCYDSLGNLESYQEEGDAILKTEYRYSSAGLLTGWSEWGFDGQELRYTCEYDESGRLTRTTGENGDTADYTYDQDGQLTSLSKKIFHGDMVGTEESAYTYDSLGRVTEKTVTSDWNFGETSVLTFEYSYDYAPFVVISEYNGEETMYVDVQYPEPTSGYVFSFFAGLTPTFDIQDGYLTRVSYDDATYEFTYTAP